MLNISNIGSSTVIQKLHLNILDCFFGGSLLKNSQNSHPKLGW